MTGIGRSVGRYEIERELGRGGMAVVYLAHQLGLERKVALKQLAGLHADEPSHGLRFLQESRLAGSLSHPNIVTVFDYFEDDGVPYISMEFVEGGSLRAHMGRLTAPQTFGVLEGVLSGLEMAHSRSIVHRDLKPENVMVTWDGRVKITDFGIAKAIDQLMTGGVKTGTGSVIGTPAYMAPEQAMAGEIGPWSDLYSLGVMAYELLVGVLPFNSSDTPLKILMRHATEPVPPPLSIRPDLDPYLAWWIERLLAKVPRDRFWSAREAWDALDERLPAMVGAAWRREAPLVPAAAASTSTAPEYETWQPPKTRQPQMTTPVIPPTPVPVAPPPPPPVPDAPLTDVDLRPPDPPPARHPRLGVLTNPVTLAVGAVMGAALALILLLPGFHGDPKVVGATAGKQTAPTQAELDAFHGAVGRICDALDKDRAELPQRQGVLKRELRDARNVRRQRDALLGEYKHLLAVSGQLLPRLEALAVPDPRLRPVRTAGVAAWRRNLRRLESRRDALESVRSFADLQRAATVPNRTAVDHDGQRINRRLLQLAPQNCELRVSASGPVITLSPPSGGSGNESGDVAPANKVAGRDVSPPLVAKPAPPKDISPAVGGGSAGGGD